MRSLQPVKFHRSDAVQGFLKALYMVNWKGQFSLSLMDRINIDLLQYSLLRDDSSRFYVIEGGTHAFIS